MLFLIPGLTGFAGCSEPAAPQDSPPSYSEIEQARRTDETAPLNQPKMDMVEPIPEERPKFD
ncbi:hypothetical protein [Sphingopyxis panaciterrae]